MTGYVAAAVASTAAGILWIAAWLHLMAAHGVTEVNERKLVLGLTWLDSGRLIAPSLLLAGVALWLLAAWYAQPLLRIAAAGAGIGLAVAFVSSILAFWTQPFGTYAGVSRETGLAVIGGPLAMLGSVVMAAGIIFFSVVATRLRVVPLWVASLLVVGALLTVPWLYESVQGVVFGIALLALGGVLLARRYSAEPRAERRS